MSSISTSSRQPTNLSKRTVAGTKATNLSLVKSKNNRNNYVDLKIVIRLLPANLSEQEFFDQLKAYHEGELSCKYYVQGELPKTPYDNPKYSRGYIKFKNIHELDEFVANVRGKPFVESSTSDSVIPIVEKSLYNKMPEVQRKKSKKRIVSLDDDPLFKSFQNHLQDPTIPFSLVNIKLGKNRRRRNDKKRFRKENDKKDESNKSEVKPKSKRVRKRKNKKVNDNSDKKSETSDNKVETPDQLKIEASKSDRKSDKPENFDKKSENGPETNSQESKKRRRRRLKKEGSSENKLKSTETKVKEVQNDANDTISEKATQKKLGEAAKDQPKKSEGAKRANKPKNKSRQKKSNDNDEKKKNISQNDKETKIN